MLVLIAIILILLALVLDPGSSAATRRQIEDRIAKWQPTDGDDEEPKPGRIVPEMDIVGNWEIRLRRTGSGIGIQKGESGRYRINFMTAGCLGSYKAERSAEFRDGILILDKPVAEYLSGVYQKLYAVRHQGTDYLLPEAFVSRFEAALSTDGSIVDAWEFKRAAYRRAEDAQRRAAVVE